MKEIQDILITAKNSIYEALDLLEPLQKQETIDKMLLAKCLVELKELSSTDIDLLEEIEERLQQ